VYICFCTGSVYLDSTYIIQMMHGSEWTLKYDVPEVENREGAA